MTAEVRSLNEVFGLGDPRMPPLRLEEASTCLADLRDRLPPGISSTYWPAVMTQVHEQVSRLLETPVAEVLVGAWRKYEPLMKYADTRRYPPDVTSVVPLLDHTVKSVLKPSIELFADEISIGTIDFEVELALELEGAVLSIRDGKCVALRIGRGTISGRLLCGGSSLVDLTSRKVELPGELDFGDGIPLVGAPDKSPD